MSSNVDAARKTQLRQFRICAHLECPDCRRILSIAEVIERHCEGCDSNIDPKEVLDRRAA